MLAYATAPAVFAFTSYSVMLAYLTAPAFFAFKWAAYATPISTERVAVAHAVARCIQRV